LQIRRILALVVRQVRELDGVQLQGGGVLEQLESFPLECANGVRVESQPDFPCRRGGWRRGHGSSGGNGLQEGATQHVCYSIATAAPRCAQINCSMREIRYS
jgi:hypothetical protein